MCKKIIQLGCLAVLSLLLAACENNAVHEYHGHAMNHDAQCLALRHDIDVMNYQHHRGWTKPRIEADKRALWKQYNKLGCP
ncbi:MAG: hypothetical protein PVG30_06165 [Gammaproteobacteria bacterium]|jgi:hypothetical protein